MQFVFESALDKLVSPRASFKSQEDALNTLEKSLAELVLLENSGKKNDLAQFLQLQDSFQCNLASRISPWLSYRTDELRKLRDYRGSGSKDNEFNAIVSLITQALSLLQGTVLLHKPSKDFLGRKNTIEVFVDLLSIYRHGSSKPFDNSTNSPSSSISSLEDQQWHPSLASAILDALLCILVDSPSAIRMFEELKGVEHIVKILKRAVIPKDTRIKCLEFLYFYLMDEASPGYKTVQEEVPSTRFSTPKKVLIGSSLYPDSRVSSSSSGTPSSSSSQSSGSRSSTASFTSVSSTPTLAETPPLTPKGSGLKGGPIRNKLEMLRKEVDFVPISPKRAKVAQLGVGHRRPGATPLTPLKFPSSIAKGRRRHPSPLGRLPSEEAMYSETDTDISLGCDTRSSIEGEDEFFGASTRHVRTRTTEEKKEILGQLLGNVDALVEGVKNAGIWGLGD